jgi:hypothetical protein
MRPWALTMMEQRRGTATLTEPYLSDRHLNWRLMNRNALSHLVKVLEQAFEGYATATIHTQMHKRNVCGFQ